MLVCCVKTVFDIRKHPFSFQYTLFDQSYIGTRYKTDDHNQYFKTKFSKNVRSWRDFYIPYLLYYHYSYKKMKSGGILTFKIVGVDNSNKKYTD